MLALVVGRDGHASHSRATAGSARTADIGLTSRSIIAAEGVPWASRCVPALADSLSPDGFVSALPAMNGHRPLVSRGMMAFAGDWEGNAQTALGLTALQKWLLQILTALPLGTAGELAPLAGSRSSRRGTGALRGLREKALVGEYIEQPSRPVRHSRATGQRHGNVTTPRWPASWPTVSFALAWYSSRLPGCGLGSPGRRHDCR